MTTDLEPLEDDNFALAEPFSFDGFQLVDRRTVIQDVAVKQVMVCAPRTRSIPSKLSTTIP